MSSRFCCSIALHPAPKNPVSPRIIPSSLVAHQLLFVCAKIRAQFWTRVWLRLVYGCLNFHPSPPPPPPPQVHFLKYLKNALSYWLETWQFKWSNFQNKYLVLNRLGSPLVTIATPKSTQVFWTTHFCSFQSSPEIDVVLPFQWRGSQI